MIRYREERRIKNARERWEDDLWRELVRVTKSRYMEWRAKRGVWHQYRDDDTVRARARAAAGALPPASLMVSCRHRRCATGRALLCTGAHAGGRVGAACRRAVLPRGRGAHSGGGGAGALRSHARASAVARRAGPVRGTACVLRVLRVLCCAVLCSAQTAHPGSSRVPHCFRVSLARLQRQGARAQRRAAHPSRRNGHPAPMARRGRPATRRALPVRPSAQHACPHAAT